MSNLSTRYMGFQLKNPLVASASPLTETVEGMLRLEEAGVSAIVMSSLFEEQIAHEGKALAHFLHLGSESYAESVSYFPELHDEFHIGPGQYLELISQAKRRLQVPLIASLNGCSPGGWTEWAKLCEEAGADALELNEYYIPTDPEISGAQIEARYLEILQNVKARTKIPVAVKLSPFFSSTANMCSRLVDAGANALVLFNRFYQPDFDLEHLEVVPRLVLSRSEELRLPLRWVAILYGRVNADFAITSGVHTHLDVIKAMMAGARVVMLASELLRSGIHRVTEILAELSCWLQENEYPSIELMQGSMSQIHVADPAAFERANYMKALNSFK